MAISNGDVSLLRHFNKNLSGRYANPATKEQQEIRATDLPMPTFKQQQKGFSQTGDGDTEPPLLEIKDPDPKELKW